MQSNALPSSGLIWKSDHTSYYSFFVWEFWALNLFSKVFCETSLHRNHDRRQYKNLPASAQPVSRKHINRADWQNPVVNQPATRLRPPRGLFYCPSLLPPVRRVCPFFAGLTVESKWNTLPNGNFRRSLLNILVNTPVFAQREKRSCTVLRGGKSGPSSLQRPPECSKYKMASRQSRSLHFRGLPMT